MKNLKLLIIPFFIIFISSELEAQNITEKGIASVELDKSTCRNGRPTDKNKHFTAIERAKKSAWEKYISTLSTDRSAAYYSDEQKFLSELDNYITDYVILTSDCSKSRRNYTVSIRVTINESKLNNELVSQSSDSSAKKNLRGQGVVVLVVPRKTTEALSFDAKVTKQAMSQSSLSADEMISTDENSTSITESSTQRESLTTGGSTSKKATKRTYTIGDLNDANTQINNILSPLGMRTFDAARLEGMATRYGYEPFLKEVLDQFSGKVGDFGANISPKTQNDIVNLIIDVGQGRLNYFLLGTVDSSVPRTDPDTGSYKSDVLVNIQLYSIDDFFGAESIAAVGPEIKTAFGETDILSEKAALKKAFNEATNSLILKL
jgi:hypothetical protein|tara:strand:+ start:1744 stop:2874 length:1131 start_codon:yes stop_codon:yes gene_type:complete